MTDLGNSKRFIEAYGDRCFYVHTSREWYLWNGCYWEKDQDGGIIRLAKKVAEQITKESIGKSEMFVKHANRSESLCAIRNMVDLARSELPMQVDRLDKHDWLLNVQNGVIDLKTGRLLPYDKKYYLSQLAPVKYDAKAAAPQWVAFLNQIMGGKSELIGLCKKRLAIR